MKKIIVLFLTLFTCISAGLGQGLYDIPVGGVLKGITAKKIIDGIGGRFVELSETSTSIYVKSLYGHPCIVTLSDPDNTGFVKSISLIYTTKEPKMIGPDLKSYGTTIEQAEKVMQDVIRGLVSNYEDPQNPMTEEELIKTMEVEEIENTWKEPLLYKGFFYYKVFVIRSGKGNPKNEATIAIISEDSSDPQTVVGGWTVHVLLESGIGQALYNYNN